jgi:FkbM family methyltransferase
MNPAARVYAFEPVKRVHEKLVYNNALNNYNVICKELALSDEDGTAVIYDTPAEHTYSVTVNKNLNPETPGAVQIPIKTARLSTFIQSEKLQQIDLIKIDVETHEPEVLAGFGPYLERMKPAMLIEILTNEVGAKVETILRGNDYLYFRVDDNGITKTDDISVKDNYCNYLVCGHDTARQLKLIETYQ